MRPTKPRAGHKPGKEGTMEITINDVTMCASDTCPVRHICLRSRESGTAPGNHQSYADFYGNPHYAPKDGKQGCSMFWYVGRKG